MKKLSLFCLVFTASVYMVMAQSPITEANYSIYDEQGNPATLQQILDIAGKSDVIFLGENHDDATAHFLQMEIFFQELISLKQQCQQLGKEQFCLIINISLEALLFLIIRI